MFLSVNFTALRLLLLPTKNYYYKDGQGGRVNTTKFTLKGFFKNKKHICFYDPVLRPKATIGFRQSPVLSDKILTETLSSQFCNENVLPDKYYEICKHYKYSNGKRSA